MSDNFSRIQLRTHGSPALPTLIYLPGMHGDWTLVTSFRAALSNQVRFVEMCYPRTLRWSLNDHAEQIERALFEAGVNDGWLLGESFGSQPAWQLLQRSLAGSSTLKIRGLILAGGFVKHPWPWGAKFLRAVTGMAPHWMLRGLLRGYAVYAVLRHRRAPETKVSIGEFVANRLHPDDPAAMQLRYTIVADCDLRPVAAQCKIPVFQLAGLVDPIVPAPLVKRWLKRHCPGYRGTRIILRADHNVLGTAPAQAARTVLAWMRAGAK
jgi:pimeloyl-ACP methyl ester carboxylesterase